MIDESKEKSRFPSKRDGLLILLVLLLSVDLGLRLMTPEAALGKETRTEEERRERRRDATVKAVMKAGQAVANISTERVVKTRTYRRMDVFDDFFEGFLPDRGRLQERKTRSLGSGIIIDGSGYILTNAHVVAQASRIVVTLKNNESLNARLVNLSEDHDLALLKVDSKKTLPTIALGRSKDLMIGETVIALGNPFGLENTVTRGVVSARDRRIVRSKKALPGTFLQTDAAINPGNSGGPLINIDAELVGINTAVHATGQGIGFAIPVDRIRKILNDLSKVETITDYWLGLDFEEVGERVQVKRVVAGSPGDRANLARGDTLKLLGGEKVRSIFDVNKIILKNLGKQAMILELERSGKLYRASLSPTLKPSVALVKKRLGLSVKSLKGGRPGTATGVLVKSVLKGGPGAKIGVAPGDIIIKVGRIVLDRRAGRAREIYRIESVDTLAGFLEQQATGSEVIIYVMRGSKQLVGEVKVR